MDGIVQGVGGSGGGGGGRVGVVEEDMSDGMQCSFHPYRSNPGGVCAFCLQDKLGKLVSSSSSFPLPIRVSSSSSSSTSSSSPPFRSDIGRIGVCNSVGSVSGGSLSLAVRPTTTESGNGGGLDQDLHTRRSKIPFLLAKKTTKSMGSSSSDRDIVFKRSKTTATPGRRNRHRHFLVASTDEDNIISPRRRGGFWSFLYLSSSAKSITASSNKTAEPSSASNTNGSLMNQNKSSGSKKLDIVVAEENGSQATGSASSFESKVSRSRSVGCGSRSFSGDFFERISTGFGDCTLRRVESQREGKPKGSRSMKERVKCGGIFSGFIINSSSSSYFVSSSENHHVNGKSKDGISAADGALANSRSRSWGWALASPMRAFSKPSSKDGIVKQTTTTPNLSAIPSLLAARG